jgi:hypothetical protein
MFGTKPQCRKIDSPGMAVPPEPVVLAEHGLSIAYRKGGDDDSWIVATFSGFLQFTHGYPNDEALGAHPLGKFGLKFYDVFEVSGSPVIEELKKRNRVHPRHTDSLFDRYRHWIFTFQDETLDVISGAEPSFRVVSASSGLDAIQRDENPNYFMRTDQRSAPLRSADPGV